VTKVVSAVRLYYLDNLRLFLSVLVIMHHASQPYGPGGAWSIPSENAPFINLIILGTFMTVNAAFFMGLFFFVSAYFLPGAYDHKGAGKLLKDRIIRLGIPIPVCMFLVFPLMRYLLSAGKTSFIDFYFSNVLGKWTSGGLSFGYLWFLELLLIFTTGYLIWKTTGPITVSMKTSFPNDRTIVGFVVVMSLASFVVRIWSPINSWVPPFSLLEPAHFPQYVMMFMAGIVAYRNDWLNKIPQKTAKRWARITWLTIPVLFVMFVCGMVGSAGGFTLPSLAYSTWESLLCVGLSISLIALFQARFNRLGTLSKTFASDSYAAYLIHLPLVVAIQAMLMSIHIHPLAKFFLTCLTAVPLTFTISHYIIRKLPYAKNIL